MDAETAMKFAKAMDAAGTKGGFLLADQPRFIMFILIVHIFIRKDSY